MTTLFVGVTTFSTNVPNILKFSEPYRKYYFAIIVKSDVKSMDKFCSACNYFIPWFKSRNWTSTWMEYTNILLDKQIDLFIFLLQTTWHSLEHCSFIHLKVIHSHARGFLKVWKQTFSRVSSHGLKLHKLKPSITTFTRRVISVTVVPVRLWPWFCLTLLWLHVNNQLLVLSTSNKG